MKERVGVGVIGCGNISSAYLTAAKNFPLLDSIKSATVIFPEPAAPAAAKKAPAAATTKK